MDLQARKSEFIKEFLKIQKEDVLARFESLLKTEKSELPVFTIEDMDERIDISEKDFQNKIFKSHFEISAKYL